MKLEPVAWTHESYLPPTAHSFAGVKNRHPSFPVALYAIPDGYVVVPVEDAKTAYICVGCEAIYWEDNVSCDCQVPSIDKFHEVKVIAKEQS